ncbi:uncharacterized protein LTR77_002169 [Saxophila tyrrhenica]|uniref:Nucleolar protein 12 n=1 Tax=Saxophila tyrrhenica TaxID=1690608 RepID=A0AAV9PL93_9PEZI|nr:hypothetical protein LTR77_002169 [Saxophila tyrrhenica]
MAPPAKRRKTAKVESLTFDPAARQEYLTGFHKRKLQRKENARELAVKREKEERVRERRQLREQRKEDLEKHVAQVNAELRKQNADLSDSDAGEEVEVEGAEDDWAGDERPAPAVVDDAEEEFVDEDKYTTVTVEPMGEDGATVEDNGEGDKAVKKDYRNAEKKGTKKRPWSKDGKAAPKKKHKFRYESKAERQATRQKQKSKNHAAKQRRMGD